MIFGKPKPSMTLQKQLALKLTRLVEGELTPSSDGGARLTVKLSQKGWASRLFRFPDDATKTFEFDPLGRFVWEQCDGRNSVQKIIRQLARNYNVSERESQVSTIHFLGTLEKKGLIGVVTESQS